MSLTEKFLFGVVTLIWFGAVAMFAKMYFSKLGDIMHQRLDKWRATRALYAIEIEFDAAGANDDGKKVILQVGQNALALWYKTPGVRSVKIIASSNSRV
tara:strand:- start:924 stop:1220 length:297 start_codon:yes stop_codon:yes gene_type:complete